MRNEEPTVQEEQSTLSLLKHMKEGDRAAGDELFRQHRTRLLRALQARLAPEMRFLVDREDLVQETFRKALLSIDRFEWRGQGAFLAWLLQIATRSIQDHARREAVAPFERLEDTRRRQPVEPTNDSWTPGALAARSEELFLLQQALDVLQEGEREAVIRRKILGQDYASMAQDLGLSEGGARMRVSRAMVRMSRSVQGSS